MPYEKINDCRTSDEKQLEVGWNRIGWVQLSVGPQEWETTADKFIVDLVPADIDKLFKVLKKAKRQAYADGYRHYGFADAGPVTVVVNHEPVLIPTVRGQMTTTDQILSIAGFDPSKHELGREFEGHLNAMTKANAYVLEGNEEFVTIRTVHDSPSEG